MEPNASVPEHVQSLAQKVEVFAGHLTEEERDAFLQILMATAPPTTADEPEVTGYVTGALFGPVVVQAYQASTTSVDATVITNLANMRHEMLKAVAQNLRS